MRMEEITFEIRGEFGPAESKLAAELSVSLTTDTTHVVVGGNGVAMTPKIEKVAGGRTYTGEDRSLALVVPIRHPKEAVAIVTAARARGQFQ